jgi:hypothetical protein
MPAPSAQRSRMTWCSEYLLSDGRNCCRTPRRRLVLLALGVLHQPSSFISVSACSNQNRISISRYVAVAVVRCSCASGRLPVRL